METNDLSPVNASPELASFGDRAIAFLIDCGILLLPSAAIQGVIPFAGPVLLGVLYKAMFEASAAGATPGKRLLGLRVTDLSGGRITLKAALIRYAISFISGACLFAGHFVALFTRRHQAVHDLIADTLVVRGKVEFDLFEAWTSELKGAFHRSKDAVHSQTRRRSERERLELLEKLYSLRQSGAITEEEYLRRKAEILRD